MCCLESYLKSFPFRTSGHSTKNAHPERPAGAEGPLTQTSPNFHFSFSNFRLTPFFSAFPYKNPVTPLLSALTLFDRGGRVILPDLRTFRPTDPFLFINLRVALPATPLFSNSSALPGVGGHPQVFPLRRRLSRAESRGHFFLGRSLLSAVSSQLSALKLVSSQLSTVDVDRFSPITNHDSRLTSVQCR